MAENRSSPLCSLPFVYLPLQRREVHESQRYIGEIIETAEAVVEGGLRRDHRPSQKFEGRHAV